MSLLCLVRHGQSVWNLENRFTGWVDVDLTPLGEDEARKAGLGLKAEGLSFQRAYVSPLKRARRTAELLLTYLGQKDLPLTESPEVIERFYGGLTGLNKAETAAEYGEQQVHVWRRSYDIAPPPLEETNPHHPANTPAFASFPFSLPATESLKDVVERVRPFYHNILLPALKNGQNVLVAAHGNSIRALLKEIRGLSDEEVQNVEIPTAVPVLVRFDAQGVYQDDQLLQL